MAYFDKSRNAYDMECGHKITNFDGIFDPNNVITNVESHIASGTWAGQEIREKEAKELEMKEKIHEKVRKHERRLRIAGGSSLGNEDFVLQHEAALEKYDSRLSYKPSSNYRAGVVLAWDKYFIDLLKPEKVNQYKEQECDEEWPEDAFPKPYVPVRQYTLEEACIRGLDLTMALMCPVMLQVTNGKPNQRDFNLVGISKPEVDIIDGNLHCRICDKYHIEQGEPGTIAKRDPCGAFLPEAGP
jgi:hypothetical protein